MLANLQSKLASLPSVCGTSLVLLNKFIAFNSPRLHPPAPIFNIHMNVVFSLTLPPSIQFGFATFFSHAN